MLKRILAALLCTAMLIPVIVSCSGNDSMPHSESAVSESNADNSGENTAETTELDKLEARQLLNDDLPEKDFNGKEFRISVMSKYQEEFYSAEETGDVCNDAVYQRNRTVGERFNMTVNPIITDYVDNDSHLKFIQKTVLAGEDAFDMTALYVYRAGIPILDGMYRNWNDVPYVDFDREWWVQSANEAYTIGGKRYIAVGSACITTLLLSYGVFFNKRITDNYNIENLYNVVNDGRWTIDYINSITKDVYSDLNGNGKADSGDLFGFTAEKVTNLDAYLPAFDQPITKFDDNGYPYFVVNCEKTYNAIQKVYNLYYENTGSYITDTAGTEIPMFAAGEAMLLTTWMNNAFTDFRNMEDDYGILPYPKYDEAQSRYLSNSMDNYSTLGIPVTASDLEFIGIAIEALSAESYKTVMPAYYDVALKTKFTRDEDSVAMLELLMDGLNYDFCVLHSSSYLQGIYTSFRKVIAAKSTDYASSYAGFEGKLDTSLANLIDIYKSL